MATKQVEIAEIGTVTLYKRKGNRSLRLSIDPRGEVRVSIPHWLPYKVGEQFARSRAEWIVSQRGTTSHALLHNKAAIGKAHRLYFVTSLQAEKVTSRIAANEIQITIPAGVDPQSEAVQKVALKACLRALKKEAEALLPQRLRTLSDKTGHPYTSMSVKQLKSRWGSCNSQQEITLNIFLMQLPWQLIDYVLIHELTHTKVMRHGTPFWDACEQLLPGARGLRKEIQRYQPVLTPRSETT